MLNLLKEYWIFVLASARAKRVPMLLGGLRQLTWQHLSSYLKILLETVQACHFQLDTWTVSLVSVW